KPLAKIASSGPEQRYNVGSNSGQLSYQLVADDPWWARWQLAGLLVLIVLALPGVQPRVRETGRRRAKAQSQKIESEDDFDDLLPRRAIGADV
ncbi:MAG: hypothetical protein FWG47_06325, partial [Propionibacteriaceae bacterium]|nr:hypothetical protein [Propionibacteriaceae bacterium]